MKETTDPTLLRKQREERKKLIEHMLCEVEVSLQDRGRRHFFIESLREWFDERGNISDKQMAALLKFYENV